MHFLVNEEWALHSPAEAFFEGPELRMYPMVEVGLNVPLWHVDLLVGTDGMHSAAYWRRFIFASIEQAIDTLQEHRDQCKLFFQDTLNSDERRGYAIQTVEALLEGNDPSGRHAYIIVLAGTRVLYPDRGYSEDLLSCVRRLFVRRDLVQSDEVLGTSS